MLKAEMKQVLLFTAEQVPSWGTGIATLCVRFPAAVVEALTAVRDILDQPAPDLGQARAVIAWLEHEAKAHVFTGDQVARKVGQSEPEMIGRGRCNDHARGQQGRGRDRPGRSEGGG